ncbi:MAG TPA: hypothetical protein VGN18_12995 [Jatrophihabitans sp.]|jgi:hypothetical protein|uniref:hypothetical protein n=1 Tax=Jatrophihabitans sp. TaxID=1932789 RepID=UPI002DFB5FC3|nr:hypothetical protein [Jatrophihabitans sp.]
MGDVDFTVTSSDDGLDEDLPQRERRPWTPVQRVVAGAVALAAVVAIGVGVAAGRTADPVAQRSSSPSSPSSPSSGSGGSSGPLTVVPRSGMITRFVVPPDVITVDANTGMVPCPRAGDGQSACQTTHTVPAGVLAALRAHFPGARVLAETDDMLRDTGMGSNGIWDRRISAVAGSIRITVLVRRALPEDVTSGTDRIDHNRLISTESTGSNGFTVTATVDVPASHPSIYGSLDLLVSDQRLLVLD